MNPLDKAILSPPRIPPLSAADIPPRWLHQVRAVILRDNHRLRAGFPACIEVKGPESWQALQLPNNGVELVGKRDVEQVLAWLTGSEGLPEVET